MKNDAKVQAAILAFQNKEYKSVRAAPLAFSVPPSTVHDRLAGELTLGMRMILAGQLQSNTRRSRCRAVVALHFGRAMDILRK